MENCKAALLLTCFFFGSCGCVDNARQPEGVSYRQANQNNDRDAIQPPGESLTQPPNNRAGE